jgi:rubrerythrin
MSQQASPEGTSHAYEQLKEKRELGEILDIAMTFERTAREFFEGLRGRVGKPIRDLVDELAAEEARHYQLFADLKADPAITERIHERICVPVDDHGFSDYLQLPELGDDPDDQAILQYALGREQAAMENYTALAEEVPEGPARDLFRFLAQEELEHKRELEKRYYELVHSGGV